ncbi:MAG: hypothetical protein D6730_14535 [Bacteroidetes bacterium]|nr:MAG: hypothetical protein D6730_14535 [Bacteroidota bacterium]
MKDQNFPKNKPHTGSSKAQVEAATPAKKKSLPKHTYILVAAAAAVVIILASIMIYTHLKVKEYSQKNTVLLEQKQLQDSLVSDFMNTFNEFEENLNQIKQREGLIALNTKDEELRSSNTDRINEDLITIDQLLQRNREIIDELTAKVEEAERKNSPLRRTIAKLKKQLAEKEARITELTGQLASMNIQLDSLNLKVVELARLTDELDGQNAELSARLSGQEEELSKQEQLIQQQTEEMNTAYFIAASKKELKEKRILLRGSRLNEDLDESAFTKIDITQTEVIPLQSKRAKILTHHPSASYELSDTDADKKPDALEIKDPQKFWRNTKYLVVVTN